MCLIYVLKNEIMFGSVDFHVLTHFQYVFREISLWKR